MDFYTYCYLDENNKPYYVGKGCGGRINAPHECGLPPKERRIFLKQGLTEEESFKHEVYMIYVLGRKDLGTGCLVNRTCGGHGTAGWVMSEETKIKISDAATGRPRPDMVGESNPMKNPETAQKIAKIKTGKPRDEQTRQKISESLKGRKDTPEVKQRKSQALKGKPKSQTHRENISKAKSGEKHPAFGKTGKESWNYGRKFYVNCEGEVKFLLEHPGEGWQPGRVWKTIEG